MRVMLSMLIILFSKVRACNIDICMVWTLRNNQLNLRCKVNYLKFTIAIINPLGYEEAHCSPPAPTSFCETHKHVGRIVQDLKTNETSLTLPDAKRNNYNGNWTCLHGFSKDKASIEITTLTAIDGITTDEDESCVSKFLSWTMVGFMSSFLLIRAIILATDCVSEGKVERLIQDLPKLCCRLQIVDERTKLNCKRITYLLVLVYFFGMPLFIGLLENNTCTAPTGFIAVGIVIGILINAIISSNEKRHVIQGDINTENNNANEHEESML